MGQLPSRHALRAVAEHIEAGRRFVARQALRTLMVRLGAEAGAETASLLEVVFATALADLLTDLEGAARTGRSRGQGADGDATDERVDLIDADFELPDAELAELLEGHAPWWRMVAEVGRAAIAEAWASSPSSGEDLALIALGPRRGGRLVELVERLAEGRLGVAMPARLHLVAVEPSALDLARLVERVGARAEALGIGDRVAVRPVCARPDGLGPNDWRRARTLCGGVAPVVHASATLRAVPTGARAALFADLADLEPRALIVEAVDHAHLGGGLVHRFDWCWAHYAPRFEALQAARIAARDRRAIEICHFGREIEALLAEGLELGRAGQASGRGRGLDDRATTWRDLAHGARFVVGGAPRTDVADAIDAIDAAGCRAAASADGIVRVVRGGVSLAAVLVAGGPPPRDDGGRGEPNAPTAGSSLVMRLDAVPRPIDVHTYLAALLTAARADHTVHDAERAFVERQASLLHVDEGTLATLPPIDVLLDAREGRGEGQPTIEPRTARAIVRDLVFLSRVDGEYHARERALIGRVAGRLGFDPAWLARIERLATVPDLIAETPSWFQEYWFLSHKS